MNFDYEKAKALLISVLHEKREEAKEKGNDLRVRNIDILLVHEEYIKKLLDLGILLDIVRFVESAEEHWNRGGITTLIRDFSFFYSPAVDPLVHIGARCIINSSPDKSKKDFSSPEDMRKYLYEVVGFEYQSYAEAKEAKEHGELIVDPLATYEEVTYGGQIDLPNLFNLIDNLEELKEMPAPVHVQSSVIKTK